ncbi:unnamed protein product [Acanthoscelides obtectus]|uniref:Uncharacterized protein n=1 Tax=Acanthoscelides obtectus TaxID=200917 RepID=A0A9P0MJP2_ACAOB|nr:unnamed protein product [Acanthoscelides obtectus]CAK1624195.1 hypothetical protein AOBTE_LOCUS2391 [Acanthoscelides obtectus]
MLVVSDTSCKLGGDFKIRLIQANNFTESSSPSTSAVGVKEESEGTKQVKCYNHKLINRSCIIYFLE